MNNARINFGLAWMFIGMLIIAYECYTLGLDNAQATLSWYMRVIRFDTIGRFILLPLWCWLTMHWILAPKWLGVKFNNWRSVVSLGFGLGWAILETLKIIG